MEIEDPEHLRKVEQIEKMQLASQVNWCLRVRDSVDEAGPRAQMQASKFPGWSARADAFVDFAPEDADRWAAALAAAGSSRLIFMSLPFYLLDNGIVAYEGSPTADAILEVAGKWASFDFVIAAFGPHIDLPKALIYTSFDDYCISFGEESLLAQLASPEEPEVTYGEGNPDYQCYLEALQVIERYRAAAVGCNVDF